MGTLTQDYTTPSKPSPSPAEVPLPETPTSVFAWSTLSTPAESPQRLPNPTILKGAVVYVDVHTSEGADASGIFVELLSQMGARCVKRWAWSPHQTGSPTPSSDVATVSTGGDIFSPGSQSVGTPAGKIGITHVVYKDGGKRTLEKVRDTNGVVCCVGVGWVLE
jgi:hypothetical protein